MKPWYKSNTKRGAIAFALFSFPWPALLEPLGAWPFDHHQWADLQKGLQTFAGAIAAFGVRDAMTPPK